MAAGQIHAVITAEEVGQKYQRSSAYIKASLLHEFGGRADTVLTLGDETLCDLSL